MFAPVFETGPCPPGGRWSYRLKPAFIRLWAGFLINRNGPRLPKWAAPLFAGNAAQRPGPRGLLEQAAPAGALCGAPLSGWLLRTASRLPFSFFFATVTLCSFLWFSFFGLELREKIACKCPALRFLRRWPCVSTLKFWGCA